LPDGSYRNYLCEGLQHYFSTVAPYMDALKKSLHL
jgi:sulfatase maturation enzyme AslB (radical SAM superfamily)